MLRSWIKEGRVNVNEMIAKNASLIVLKDQVVSVGQRKKIVAPGIPILYEDDDLVIVDKPTGLLSVAPHLKGETLHALLKTHFRPRKVFVSTVLIKIPQVSWCSLSIKRRSND